MDAEPQPEPSEPAHFSRSRSRWSTVYLMDFHVLPYVLVMIQMNGAGVGAGTTRAGTICPDPEPKPPEHFTRTGAGSGIVPRSRSRSRPKCGRLRMPDFQATKFLFLFLFWCFIFIHFGQVASSTLSRSDGSQCRCTNAVALHARHFALWNHWTIETTRIFLVTLPSLSLTRYRYLSCMCIAMPITWDWHRRSCAAGAKFYVLKLHNYKTGWILLTPNGPSFSLPKICHILVPISIQMKLLKMLPGRRRKILDFEIIKLLSVGTAHSDTSGRFDLPV